MRDLGWMKRAACRRVEEWLVGAWDVSSEHGSAGTRAARSICRTECPVQAECLEYGRAERLDGVYGGLMLLGGVAQDRHRYGAA